MSTCPSLRRLILGALLLLLPACPVHAAPAAAPQDGAYASPPSEPSSTSGEPCSGEGVYLYEDIDYGGACIKFTLGDTELGDDGWHDRASSIKFVGSDYINGRACATLYEHANFGGARTRLCGSDPWLGDDAVGNDRADSILLELFALCSQVSQIPETECDALASLFYSTNGLLWTTNTGWMTNHLPCSWYGVTCTDGRVTRLSLSGNHLAGPLPLTLYALTSLRELYLSANQLSGDIPTSLGSLPALEALGLGGNSFTGGIPSSLGSLPNLNYLNLVQNQLTGGIPTSLGSLANLTRLWLYSNQLSGPIPSSLGSLSKLESLLLSQNQLNGSIPPELGSLSKLTALRLDHNQLSGSIPSSLGSLSNLTELYLYDNQLTGSIPSSLGSLSKMGELRLDSNGLSGSLPSTLGNASAMYRLSVHNNPLTGSLPQNLKNAPLVRLWFDNTYICEPPDAAFQAWLAGIIDLRRTNVLCTSGTPSATPMRSPTPSRTIVGGPRRMNLPLLMKQHWTARPEDCTELLTNGGFESGGLTAWSSWGNVATGTGRNSPGGAQMGGVNNAEGELWQTFFVPADAESVTWRFWWKPATSVTQPEDFLRVYTDVGEIHLQYWLLRAQGALDQWQLVEVDLTQWAGRWVMAALQVETDGATPTTFRIDDASVLACAP